MLNEKKTSLRYCVDNTIMTKLEELRKCLIKSCAVTVYAAGKLTDNKVYFVPKEIKTRDSIVASPDIIGRELQFCCQQGTCKQEPNCEEKNTHEDLRYMLL
jgi:hypothetical protein